MRTPFLVIAAFLTASAASYVLVRTNTIQHMVEVEHSSAPQFDGGALYKALTERGLIAKQGDALVLPPQDLELQEAMEARRQGLPYPPEDDAEWQERHRLLASLHNWRDSQGRAVGTAVRTWNASRSLVAVRDDRWGSHDRPLQQGDRPNAWMASDLWDRPLSAAPIDVPETFAFINGGIAPPGMGDWKTVLGSTGQAIRLRTTVTVERASTVTVQVIGHLDLNASRIPPSLTPRVVWRCREGSSASTPCPGGSGAASITFARMEPGTHDLMLQVIPASYDDLRVPDLQLVRNVDGTLPTWRPRILPGQPPAQGTITISSSDGVDLWKDGRPSEEAIRLNLLPVLGVDSHHPWSLAGRIAAGPQRAQDVELSLSIDTQVQAAAQAALSETIDRQFGGRDDDAPYRDRRRASLVVMDPDTGAILATAQYPAVPAGLHTYDHAALAAGDPMRDPLAPIGWSAIGPANNPASAIKPLIGLAATTKAPEDSRVRAAIQGCRPDAKGFLACMGLGLHQQRILLPGQSCRGRQCGILNFRSNRGVETLAEAMNTPARSPRCAPVARQDAPIGMVKALLTSNNVYSVRLADLIDGTMARAYDEAARRRAAHAPLPDLIDSPLVRAMETVGLFERIDLLSPIGAEVAPGGPRDGLRVSPALSEYQALTDPRSKLRRNSGALDALAQTAIGQRIEVAPLHLARMISAIRGGAVPQPHIVAAWNGAAVRSPVATPLPAGIDLSALRDGMKGVPETGTASSAFGGPDAGPSMRPDATSAALRTARCHVSGKTGTGQIGSHEQGNTGWFIGSAEPEALDALALDGGPPAWRGGPLAFACMITPVQGQITGADGRIEVTRTGGSTCAPAVADFLLRLASSRT